MLMIMDCPVKWIPCIIFYKHPVIRATLDVDGDISKEEFIVNVMQIQSIYDTLKETEERS